LKIVIINDQSFAGDYKFFKFNGLNLDNVRMNNCSLNGADFSPYCRIKQLDMHLTTFYGHNLVHFNTLIEGWRITNYRACPIDSDGGSPCPPSIYLGSPELCFLEVWNASDYNQPSDILFQVEISSYVSKLKYLKWNAKNAYLQMGDYLESLTKFKAYRGTDPSKVYVKHSKDSNWVISDLSSLLLSKSILDRILYETDLKRLTWEVAKEHEVVGRTREDDKEEDADCNMS